MEGLEDPDDFIGEFSEFKCDSIPSENSLRFEIFNLRVFILPELE